MPSWTNPTGLRREPGRAVLRPEVLDQHMSRQMVPTAGALSTWVDQVWSLAWQEAPPPTTT
ncbi:hypothetical protein [Modestobacter sp. URMC 112]